MEGGDGRGWGPHALVAAPMPSAQSSAVTSNDEGHLHQLACDAATGWYVPSAPGPALLCMHAGAVPRLRMHACFRVALNKTSIQLQQSA